MEALKKRLKQRTTWVGIMGLIASAVLSGGAPSAEAVITVLQSLQLVAVDQ